MFSIRDLLTKKLAEQTGFSVSVEKCEANPFAGRVHLQDLEIRNPELFPVGDFLEVREVRVRASPSSFLTGPLHVREVLVDLGRLTGVRSACGRINLEQFRRGLEGAEKREAMARSRAGGKPRVLIDQLNLKLESFATADYAGNLVQREYPVRVDMRVENLGEPLNLGPLLVEAVAGKGLSHAGNAIFAALLPQLLWLKIRAALDPSLAHLIACPEEV